MYLSIEWETEELKDSPCTYIGSSGLDISTEENGCRHSSVDSSAPSILPPQVQVPSTPSMLFSIYIVQIVYLLFELECEKNENKQKEAQFL